MKLSEATAHYVAHKQSMGMRFCPEARTLKSFCRAMGEVAVHEIRPSYVLAYLAGHGPVTRFWQRKHEALSGFYRFAIARGYATYSPLPRTIPRPMRSFVPYIYSREELRRLLDATVAIDHPRSSIDPVTYRMLLLVLYGTGLRISEALALTLVDVDLTAGVLHVRESKFYKTRLVPLGVDLIRLLVRYNSTRRPDYAKRDSPFFLSRYGSAVTHKAAENTFRRLRIRAGVLRNDGCPRHQPRLHDLRHYSGNRAQMASFQENLALVDTVWRNNQRAFRRAGTRSLGR